MKLIKVRDNQNRPVSGLDLIMSAVFGGSVPREFISGEYYQVGEHVYQLTEDGNLYIYQCNVSGKHLRCEDPGFSKWSLEALLEKYSDAIMSVNEISNDPILYESKSVVAPSIMYQESDGFAKFIAKTDEFNLNDYQGPHDVIDVYLRRELSDSYLSPTEYTFDGTYVTAEIPIADIEYPSVAETKFYPEGVDTANITSKQYYLTSEEYPEALLNIDGRHYNYIAVIDDDPDNTIYYWYGEDGIEKYYPFTQYGINLKDFNVLKEINKPIEFGYKICDLKINAIHTIVESPLNGLQAKTVYRLDEIDILGNHDPIGSEISSNVQTITIPVDIEPTRNLTDELYVTLDTENQLLNVTCKNGHIKQIRFSLTARKLQPLSAFIIGTKAKSNLSKFIYTINEFGEVTDIDGEKYIKVPYYDMLKYNSYDFELYVNRIFTANYERYIDDSGQLYLKLLDSSVVDYGKDTFLFHIYYTISQSILISRTSDEQIVEDDKDAFRIFLTTEYINKFQWLKLREDYKLLPPEVTVGSKNTANISDPNYYLKEYQTLRADVFSLLMRDITKRITESTVSCNSESYPVMIQTKNITIPFIDYNQENDDFLLFKSGGILLNSSKWYLDGDQVQLYAHENPLNKGDFVDFRLLDRDNTVRIYNKFLDITINNQAVIDVGVDISNVAFLLLFTMSGQFISPSKYVVEGTTIRFLKDCNQPFELLVGGRLELIYGAYKENYCRTIYNTLQIVATTNDQKEFVIDEKLDFNIRSDNVLIFREDGMYVGEKFYSIDEPNDKIIIDKGSGVSEGSHLDIVVIRNLSLDIPVV